MSETALLPILAEHIRAVNTFDEDAIAATFAEDAFVNDVRREFRGRAAIRRWLAKEIVGDKVTLEVLEVVDHYGDQIVRARYDGEYDKTTLPGDLIMTSYFTVCDDTITSLIIVRNEPAY
ncbi:nuclear transport factor 2 family protein [Nocardia sp. BMG111209]|uniref:nuclear transport factor 2 family protein n=1 Tax=Nocardia sp. BMG111209 TaxID=1160137 RepID=UPI0005611EF0|nr:nuclear transport factor 2 family protein [Nocardia sp. BMG111209]